MCGLYKINTEGYKWNATFTDLTSVEFPIGLRTYETWNVSELRIEPIPSLGQLQIDSGFLVDSAGYAEIKATQSQVDSGTFYDGIEIIYSEINGAIEADIRQAPTATITVKNVKLISGNRSTYINQSRCVWFEGVQREVNFTITNPIENISKHTQVDVKLQGKVRFQKVVGSVWYQGNLIIFPSNTPGVVEFTNPEISTIETEHEEEYFDGVMFSWVVPESEWKIEIFADSLKVKDNGITIPFFLFGLLNMIIPFTWLWAYRVREKHIGNNYYELPDRNAHSTALFTSIVLTFVAHSSYIEWGTDYYGMPIYFVTCGPFLCLLLVSGIYLKVSKRSAGRAQISMAIGASFLFPILTLINFTLNSYNVAIYLLLPLGMFFLFFGIFYRLLIQ